MICPIYFLTKEQNPSSKYREEGKVIVSERILVVVVRHEEGRRRK
jgi:hypothetical protein